MAINVMGRSTRYASGVQKRSGTAAVYNKSKAAGIVVDTADSYKLKYNQNGTVVTVLDSTGLGLVSGETKFCTTQFDAVTGTTGTTLTNVVGLTGFTLAAAGVYQFEVNIAGVSTANCGIKLGFKYTTATLTNMEAIGAGFTASAVAVQHSTSTTDQASLFAQTAAVIHVRITGRITVNAAGTLAVQAAQNAAHADTTSVYVGSYATFRRIS